MINVNGYIIDHFIERLKASYFESYGLLEPEFPNIAAFTARLALENLSNCDAPYHNLEHTILVTDVGISILRGKHLQSGELEPIDWLHAVVAMLCHDIGYIRGVCNGDEENSFVIDSKNTRISVKRGSTDASLLNYHVDRSKLFVQQWFGKKTKLKSDVIQHYIEMTRFPHTEENEHEDHDSLGSMVRAADLIGQLGDVHYLRKSAALFAEFQESGIDKELGYVSAADLRENYPTFFWKSIAPVIQPALTYLRKTHEGRLWIAGLFSNVFAEEHMLKTPGASK